MGALEVGDPLVMGRAGFIGSHLVDKLVSRGLGVTVFGDVSTRKSLESITLKR